MDAIFVFIVASVLATAGCSSSMELRRCLLLCLLVDSFPVMSLTDIDSPYLLSAYRNCFCVLAPGLPLCLKKTSRRLDQLNITVQKSAAGDEHAPALRILRFKGHHRFCVICAPCVLASPYPSSNPTSALFSPPHRAR